MLFSDMSRPKDDTWCTIRRKRLFHYLKDEIFIIRGKKYIVPKGYIFDGATVPRALQGFISVTGISFEAASLHDYLYDTQGKGLKGEYNLTREEVDMIFFMHMLQEGVPKSQAKLMYWAVRTPVGQKYWNTASFPDYIKT